MPLHMNLTLDLATPMNYLEDWRAKTYLVRLLTHYLSLLIFSSIP